MVAYQETGHALVAHYLPLCDDVQLVTIVPRGNGAGGYTLVLPEQETDFSTRLQLTQDICMMLGGHAAEKLMLNDNTNGATSDLQRATQLAHSMVTKFGMSDEIGTVYLGNDEQVFVGMEFGQSRAYSEQTAARIDEAVSNLLSSCYERAYNILKEHRDMLERVADLLYDRETITRQEFLSIVDPTPAIETPAAEPEATPAADESGEEN